MIRILLSSSSGSSGGLLLFERALMLLRKCSVSIVIYSITTLTFISSSCGKCHIVVLNKFVLVVNIVIVCMLLLLWLLSNGVNPNIWT